MAEPSFGIRHVPTPLILHFLRAEAVLDFSEFSTIFTLERSKSFKLNKRGV